MNLHLPKPDTAHAIVMLVMAALLVIICRCSGMGVGQ